MRFVSALLLATGILLGGEHAFGGETAATAVVEDWISVTVPQGFSWHETAAGMVILQSGGVRSPMQIEIFRGKLAGIMLGKARATAAGPARFQITKHETGGSGGPTWRIRIDLVNATVIAQQQREATPPDFSIVWQVVDSIRSANRE